MKGREEVEQKLAEVDKEIRETAGTATEIAWRQLQRTSAILRWVLDVPMEKL